MEKGLDHIWKTALKDIAIEVSEANFFTLFKKTALISLEDNRATVAAPSTMIIDLLQKRFHSIIKKILDKQLDNNISLVFVPKTVSADQTDSSKDTPLFGKPQAIQLPKAAATGSIGHLPRVRPDYTFENLAVSASNQLAYVSATTVAKNLGRIYNPFFLYGPVGVGKTHLMQAIANDVYQKTPEKKIIYITSEEFTNEVVEAIRTNDTARMKRRFRSASLLLIDDIQFVEGKERVQEELFHTFNILIDNGSQIVLTSDRPPSEIKKLEKRLSSRFAGGLTVDIEPPDFELRSAILLIKARKYEVDLPIDAAKTIAEKAQDIRSLEGLLLRVITEVKTKNITITNDLVIEILKGGATQQHGHTHPDDIIKQVCSYYNVKQTQLKGPKRDASLVKPRQITMYLLKKQLGLTLVEIGNLLGGRDHTTVMHGVTKVENMLTERSMIVEEIKGITKNIST